MMGYCRYFNFQAGVQQELFFSIGMNIVDIAHPFADDEVAAGRGFDAVAAVGQVGDGSEVLIGVGKEPGLSPA